MKHLLGVKLLNKSEMLIVIFHQLFQSAEEIFFNNSILNNMDKTSNK